MKIRIVRLAVRSMIVFALSCLFAYGALAQSKPVQDGRALNIKPGEDIRELPGKATRFALIIGVDNYTDTQITTLGGSSNDARLLADALVRYGGFPLDQVILLASDQPVERRPSRGNILRRLSNLATIVPKDGLLLFAFAGHGMERGGQAFLMPSDAQLSDDVNLLEQTAINVTQIREWIQKTAVQQVLLILDACRNDPAGRANVDNPLTESYKRGFSFSVRNKEVTAFATLYATTIGHRAYEFKEKRHGYFTWALVEGMKGGAANSEGEVTLGSLVSYLQERVPKQVLLDLGKGMHQRPFAVIEGYKADELVISVANPDEVIETISETPSQPSEETERPATGSKDAPRTAESMLEGTTWTGTNENGEFTIEFLEGEKLRYTLLSNNHPVGGTWKQVGELVQITIGSFSTAEGTFEKGVIRLEGSNVEGRKYRMFLTPKK